VTEPIDYDGAWKEALERYLRPFLELCFPLAAAGIDWAVATEFLDQELQQVVRDADLGKQRTDKLVKVQRLDGENENQNMPHITSIERLSRQEGRQEGQQESRQEGILDIVQARFGEVPYTLREHILALRDEAELKRLLRQSALVNTLADFCALIAQPSPPG
jgi:hypothetical protein